MKKTQNAAGGRPKKTARRVAFPTDAESVELRRQGAEREAARVTRRNPDGTDRFFGAFDVASAQWKHPYRVEIRSLSEPLNTCACQDHRMNALGTCKHVERTLQFLAHRRRRLFAAAADRGSPAYEVFFDARVQPPRLRLLRPEKRVPAIDARLDALFDAAGDAVGEPVATWTALEAALAAMGHRSRGHVRLSEQAGYWLARERRRADLRTLRQRFEADLAAGKITDNPVRLPLYPYQKQGMRHLAFNGRALLADDMGLGKTAQAIAAAELLRQLGQVRRVLVVSPTSLKTEWEEQIAQFTGLQAHPVFGPRAARLQAYAQDRAYTLSNYEQVRGDLDDINRLLVPDLVILDEAQRIKNWPTRTAKTIKRLDSPFAFVLTGTPLENRIEELYSLVEFVDPHVFGSLFRFQREYMEITPENEIRPRNLDRLHRVVSTVMLRRRKSDVEDTLPERTDKNFFVPMTDEQRTRYAELEYQAAQLVAILKRRPLSPKEHDRLQMLLACMRMTCDTPYILDPDCRDCPKVEELESVLDEILSEEDAKAIVFSEWVRMLDLVKERLAAKGIGFAEHTGRVPQQKRRAEIRRFKQDPECRIFLSSESGGAGLNLQVARVVINLDLPWNPAKLEQRIARAWRKHQKNAVRVINLVAENSIEQGMLGKLAYKTALSDSVLDGAAFQPPSRGQAARSAFAERVSELIGGEPQAARPAPEPKPEEDARGVLATRQAGQVLGIERDPATGATLVVARPGADLAALRAEVAVMGKGKVEVLTPDAKDLLLRLQAMGLLTLSPELAAVHAAEGYVPLRNAAPARPALRYDAAREIWKRAQPELKAAEALGGIGLAAQAAPHLRAVLGKGGQALAALYGVADGDPIPAHAAAMHRALARDAAELAAVDEPDESGIDRGLALAADIRRAVEGTASVD